VISALGSGLAVAPLAAELLVVGGPLGTIEYVTTVIVGGILALVGPIVLGVKTKHMGEVGEQLASRTASDAVADAKAQQQAEDSMKRTQPPGGMPRSKTRRHQRLPWSRKG
jgi:hypothetical protein